MKLPEVTVATAPTNPPDGLLIIVTDGDNGARCLAFSADGQWLRIEPTLGSPISAGTPVNTHQEIAPDVYAH
ncbi:hypothetical protein [Hyphomicrobium sp. CS1BSMeth3]|uniref:hypothetical protein n=1 Tax=Hyphomicrobium sp. CS1BSMeth3 TaxID=1892844 RepID=UPI000930523D|nr:hypothetical protein [Hyphomicrobium sp. CS1BSMeth3]